MTTRHLQQERHQADVDDSFHERALNQWGTDGGFVPDPLDGEGKGDASDASDTSNRNLLYLSATGQATSASSNGVGHDGSDATDTFAAKVSSFIDGYDTSDTSSPEAMIFNLGDPEIPAEHIGNPKKMAQHLLTRHKMRLFNDQFGKPHAAVNEEEGRIIYRQDSRRFRDFVDQSCIEVLGDVPPDGLVGRVRKLFRAFSRKRYCHLENRFATGANGEIYIDIGDDSGDAIHIGPGDWDIVNDGQPRFFRFAHTKPIVRPDRAGDLWELKKYLPEMSEEDTLLVLVWVVLAAVQSIARPILLVTGDKGSGKTTFFTRLRELIDPSAVPLLGDDLRADLPLTLRRHAVPMFDNTGKWKAELCNLMCQGVSGGGIDRRELYSDDGQFIISFKRSIAINGLVPPTNQPDLLDRCLPIELPSLKKGSHRALKPVEDQFHNALPGLVGGWCNVLARALAYQDQVSTEGLSRLADFHLRGRAVTRALGVEESVFDGAYAAAIERQKQAARDNPTVHALYLFARSVEKCKKTAQDLLKCLVKVAREHHLRMDDERFFPKSATVLGKRLDSLADEIEAFGVTIQRSKDKDRWIEVSYDPQADVAGNG